VKESGKEQWGVVILGWIWVEYSRVMVGVKRLASNGALAALQLQEISTRRTCRQVFAGLDCMYFGQVGTYGKVL
jgi:hypothetical protein